MHRAWLSLIVVVSILTLLIGVSPASAVVLHPGYDNTSGLSKPNANVVGKAGASVVAIAPQYVLTARHIGLKEGSTVKFGSKSYKVKQTWTFGTADLELARIDGKLSHYAPLYTKTDELRKTIVVGGYGKGRGSTDTYKGKAYAYNWGSSGLRFGANKIDGSGTIRAGGYTSKSLSIDFDPAGSSTAVKYEAAMAMLDSGAGWFIKDGGTWKTIGISVAVESSGESKFRGKTGMVDPDWNWAVRVSQYAKEIQKKMGSKAYSTSSSLSSSGSGAQLIPEPGTAVLILGSMVLYAARRTRA